MNIDSVSETESPFFYNFDESFFDQSPFLLADSTTPASPISFELERFMPSFPAQDSDDIVFNDLPPVCLGQEKEKDEGAFPWLPCERPPQPWRPQTADEYKRTSGICDDLLFFIKRRTDVCIKENLYNFYYAESTTEQTDLIVEPWCIQVDPSCENTEWPLRVGVVEIVLYDHIRIISCKTVYRICLFHDNRAELIDNSRPEIVHKFYCLDGVYQFLYGLQSVSPDEEINPLDEPDRANDLWHERLRILQVQFAFIESQIHQSVIVDFLKCDEEI